MVEKNEELEVKNKQKEVSSSVSKELRDHFGRGPESVFVSLTPCVVVIHIRNFLSPIESVLMKQEGLKGVESLREILMKSVLPEIKTKISASFDIKDFEFFYDWNIDQKSGMIIGIHWDKIDRQEIEKSFYGAMNQEIRKISETAEKQPEHVFTYQVNPRTIISGREGILIRIEKELISLGSGETLQIAKRRLEKRLLNEGEFNKILGVSVQDIFVHWDFESDKSIIVFITDPF
ncbi:Na-translocating system protein MpsC family protein [Salipaludibacillus sp. CF4.18]|uniref:Na-translocating system protein MpsC family protein n=1 Tax=Salipaludibacillus sp. CF4.18 TaxID=3373081 RepID=UPI003EE64E27